MALTPPRSRSATASGSKPRTKPTRTRSSERSCRRERGERGEMSDWKRIALAEKLADLARDLLWRSHRLARVARKLRAGEE